MKIAHFIIDDFWSFEKNQMDNPSWYRTVHGDFCVMPGLIAKHCDISVSQHLPNCNWYLHFENKIFRKEYITMFCKRNEFSYIEFEFNSLELAKERIDKFLDKLSKLKIFL